jgi:transglutaminase-like putative cysteine protease
MKYRVLHHTTYHYSEMVSLCHNEVHLAPRNYTQQTCLSSRLEITPTPSALSERRDYFGNTAAIFAIQERHQRLDILAESRVEVLSYSPPAASLTPAWEDVREMLSGKEAPRHLDATQFVHESFYVKHGEAFAEYALQSFPRNRPVLEGAMELMARIHADFIYDTKATNMTTSVAQAFELRRGVCQDFAHIQIACLRSLGLAARYVSGYLLTTPPPGKERLVGADASHAWLSVYCPGFGWIDLDPTNNLVPSDKHVLISWGRDYADVCPIKGVILGGGQHAIQVSVDVAPM